MQLKLRRSQRTGGVLGNTTIFIVNAIAEFTPEEAENIRRYKLHNANIYSSEGSKRALARTDALLAQNTIGSNLKSLAFTALAAMNLNISVASIQKGHQIECKDLDEVLGAEEALMEACEKLRAYLDTAATFDGREVLISFDEGRPEVIARSVTPAPMLTTAPKAETAPAPQIALPTPNEDDAAYSFRPAPSLRSGAGPSSGAMSDNAKLLILAAFILFAILLFWMFFLQHPGG